MGSWEAGGSCYFWTFLHLPTSLSAQSWTYLQPVAHLHECTGWMEGPRATGQQMGAVVGMQQLHEIHALSLVGRQGQGQ